jgi:hypothetical protein
MDMVDDVSVDDKLDGSLSLFTKGRVLFQDILIISEDDY